MNTFYIDRTDKAAWSNGFANLTAGMFSGEISWWANPLMIPAWIFAYKRNIFGSIFFSGVALCLMLQFLTVDEVLSSESGATSRVTDLLIGYWLWVSSAAIVLVGFVLIHFYGNKKETEEENF